MTATVIGGWNFAGTGKTLGDLEAMPRYEREAILAGTVAVLREKQEEIKQQLAEAEGYLRDEMLERGATVADAGAWEVKLSVRRRYEYDAEGLSQLQGFIEPEQYDAAVIPVPATVKVNKTQLNQLVKRGGEVAEIIAVATKEQIAGYELSVERRKGHP